MKKVLILFFVFVSNFILYYYFDKDRNTKCLSLAENDSDFIRKRTFNNTVIVEKEVIVAVIKVREQKKTEAKKVAKQKADYVFKINDKVRIIDSNACGTIDKIEKNNAFINYGIFTTKTTLNKLELVESAKK